jgi:hypothetical protein
MLRTGRQKGRRRGGRAEGRKVEADEGDEGDDHFFYMKFCGHYDDLEGR